MDGIWNDFQEWAAHPFSEDMPASHWFMLIGLVLVCVIMWNIILRLLLEAIANA